MGNLLSMLPIVGYRNNENTEPEVCLKCCTVENSWLEISFQNEVSAAIRGSWISLNFVVPPAVTRIAIDCAAPEQDGARQDSTNDGSRQEGTLNKLEVEVEVSPSLSVASSAELEDAEHESVRSVGGATSIDLQTDTDRCSFYAGTSSKDNSSAEVFVTPRRSHCSSSLSLSTSLNSPREAKRRTIADVLQRRIAMLVDKIDPGKVSRQLYAIAVIDQSEVEKANDQDVSERERANELVLLIIQKLRSQPEWFEDICTVLNKAGVFAIEEAKAEVERRCPEDSLLSSTELHYRMLDEEVASILSTLESHYKTNGLESAKEFIQSQTENNHELQLIHGACKEDVDICILNFLLTETDYNVNTRDNHGHTPLHVVCASLQQPDSSDAESIVQERQKRMKIENLLKHGADCTLQDDDGNTALHLSTMGKDMDAVRLLLSYSLQCINLANKDGNTAIHIACQEGLVNIAQLLCSHRPNVTTQNESENKTPLHYACSWDSPALVGALLKCDHGREYVDAHDKNGDTALHIASRNGYKKVVQELLSRKANKNLTNSEEKTPAQVALDGDHNKAAELLLRKRRWLKGSGKKAVRKLKRSAPHTSIISDESEGEENIADKQ